METNQTNIQSVRVRLCCGWHFNNFIWDPFQDCSLLWSRGLWWQRTCRGFRIGDKPTDCPNTSTPPQKPCGAKYLPKECFWNWISKQFSKYSTYSIDFNFVNIRTVGVYLVFAGNRDDIEWHDQGVCEQEDNGDTSRFSQKCLPSVPSHCQSGLMAHCLAVDIDQDFEIFHNKVKDTILAKRVIYTLTYSW